MKNHIFLIAFGLIVVSALVGGCTMSDSEVQAYIDSHPSEIAQYVDSHGAMISNYLQEHPEILQKITFPETMGPEGQNEPVSEETTAVPTSEPTETTTTEVQETTPTATETIVPTTVTPTETPTPTPTPTPTATIPETMVTQIDSTPIPTTIIQTVIPTTATPIPTPTPTPICTGAHGQPALTFPSNPSLVSITPETSGVFSGHLACTYSGSDKLSGACQITALISASGYPTYNKITDPAEYRSISFTFVDVGDCNYEISSVPNVNWNYMFDPSSVTSEPRLMHFDKQTGDITIDGYENDGISFHQWTEQELMRG